MRIFDLVTVKPDGGKQVHFYLVIREARENVFHAKLPCYFSRGASNIPRRGPLQ